MTGNDSGTSYFSKTYTAQENWGGVVVLPAGTYNITGLWVPPGVSLVGAKHPNGLPATILKKIPNSWKAGYKGYWYDRNNEYPDSGGTGCPSDCSLEDLPGDMIYLAPGLGAADAFVVPRPHLENIGLDGNWNADPNSVGTSNSAWAEVHYAVLSSAQSEAGFFCLAQQRNDGTIRPTGSSFYVDGVDLYAVRDHYSGMHHIDVLVNACENTYRNAIWRLYKAYDGAWVFGRVGKDVDARNYSQYMYVRGGVQYGRSAIKNRQIGVSNYWDGAARDQATRWRAPAGIFAAAAQSDPNYDSTLYRLYRSFTAENVRVQNVIGDGVVVETSRIQTKISNIHVDGAGGNGFNLKGSDMLVTGCSAQNTYGDSANVEWSATPRFIGCNLGAPIAFTNIGRIPDTTSTLTDIVGKYAFSLRVHETREFQFAGGEISGQVYIDKRKPSGSMPYEYQNIKFNGVSFRFGRENQVTLDFHNDFKPMGRNGFIYTNDVAALSVLGSTYDGSSSPVPFAYAYDDTSTDVQPGISVLNDAYNPIPCDDVYCKTDTVGAETRGMADIRSVMDVRAAWDAKIGFNVESYNAFGNDDVDDTVAIQNAINKAASSAPAIVYFPTGTYRVKTLWVPPGVALVGGNRTETVLLHAPDSANHTYNRWCPNGVAGEQITKPTNLIQVANYTCLGRPDLGSMALPNALANPLNVVHMENMTLTSVGGDLAGTYAGTAAIYVEGAEPASGKQASITAYNVTISKNFGDGLVVGKGRYFTSLREVHTVGNKGRGMIFNSGGVEAARCGSGGNKGHSLVLDGLDGAKLDGAKFIGCEFWYPNDTDKTTPAIFVNNAINVRDSFGEVNGQAYVSNSRVVMDNVNAKLNRPIWNSLRNHGIFIGDGNSTNITLNDCAYLPDYDGTDVMEPKPSYIVELRNEATASINGGYLAGKGNAYYYPLAVGGSVANSCGAQLGGFYRYNNKVLQKVENACEVLN